MKFKVEIDSELNPDAVGEYLRSSFFDERVRSRRSYERDPRGRVHARDTSYKGTGCYSTFEWQSDVVPLEQVEVDPEESEGASKLYWARGKKLFDGKTIECRWYWDGDGILVFEFPDGKCLVNDDCKKDHGWELVGSREECWWEQHK